MKFNKLVPELTVSSFEKSLKFYTKTLGFKVEYQRKNPNFAFLSFQGSQIMIEEKHDCAPEWVTGKLKRPFGRGINFQIEVKDVKALAKRIKKSPAVERINDNDIFRPPTMKKIGVIIA